MKNEPQNFARGLYMNIILGMGLGRLYQMTSMRHGRIWVKQYSNPPET